MATEGWAWLYVSPIWHYFRNGKSLCGKWKLRSDYLDPDERRRGSDCKKCAQKRAEELEKEKLYGKV